MNMTTSYMRRVEYEQQVEAGSILLRGLMAEGARGSAVRWAEQVYGPRDPRTERIKAAVTAPLTTDLDPVNALLGPFLERVRKPALIPRLPSVRYAPFNVRVPITTTPTLAAWTAEGGAVPVTTIGFTLGVLVTKKISSILPWPREFARLSTSQGNTLGERDLGTTIVTMEDTSLLSDAAETAAQPAGLLAGLSPVGDGGSPSTLADDVEVLFGECRGADPAAPVFITSPRGGLFLAMATDASGGKLFPNARGTDGGDLGGIPLLISKAAGSI